MNMPIEITKEITSFLSSTGTLWLLMLFGYLLARRGLDKYMKWRSKQ